jgi:small acid-soluble spore protein H (minor)
MDVRRAQEILDSPQTVHVNYEGKPIWIEEVFETSDTARVHYVNNPDQIEHVRVEELREA